MPFLVAPGSRHTHPGYLADLHHMLGWCPGTISGTDGVNISPSQAVKLAISVDEPLRTVARYGRTQSGYLLIHARLVLYASGYGSPGTILLEKMELQSENNRFDIALMYFINEYTEIVTEMENIERKTMIIGKH